VRWGLGGAGWRCPEPGEQLGGGPFAGVAARGAEPGDAFLAEVGGRGRGRVAAEELQGDFGLQVGEDCGGSGPVGVQQRGQLVDRGYPHLYQVVAGADYGADRLGLSRVWGGGGQPVPPQPQVFRDHRGVGGIGLGTREHLAFAPGLDRVRADRYHRMPGLQQQVDQPPVATFDPDWDVDRLTELGQPTQQQGDPIGGMRHGELRQHLPFDVDHAHGVDLSSPVDADEELSGGQGKRQSNSSQWQRRRLGGDEASSRVVTNRRSAAHLPVADLQPRENRGRWCHLGPRRATATDRHPGSRRVPTASTVTVPTRKSVP
jgi:hypothetical protein